MDAARETLEDVQARVAIANKFSWMVVSGLTALVLREKGEAALNAIWRALLSSEQKARFREALVKLGIDKDPPAVAAARYHYHSNSIGGLSMQIVEETRRKVWIRYLAPWGSYPGIAALAVPPSVRHTILSTWHPRNGELLGCPRLGWVATKFVSEGHPYDEGYFCEYDHDIAPEERFQVRHVERTPEFDPANAPRLDPAIWPEIRVAKGGFNYGVDYVRHTLQIVEGLFGAPAARHLYETAMRLLAVQFTADFANVLGIGGSAPADLAALFAGILRSYRNDCRIEDLGGGSVRLTAHSLKPFDEVPSATASATLFAFFQMATRVRNGRLSIERQPGQGAEAWLIADAGRWMW